jgi:hypothetical protein
MFDSNVETGFFYDTAGRLCAPKMKDVAEGLAFKAPSLAGVRADHIERSEQLYGILWR